MEATKSRTRGQKAYKELQNLIKSGKLPPGKRVTEVATAKMLRVSRNTVREALVRLEMDGYLVGDGTHRSRRVRFEENMGTDEIISALEVREAILSQAAGLAAVHMTGVQVKVLRKLAGHYLNKGKNREAERFARRAVEIEPKSSMAWLMLGAARQAMRDRTGAREAYRSCAEQAEGRYVRECRNLLR